MGVAAAETTKTVTWSEHDEVIRVEIGDKVIATAPTASVVVAGKTETCNGTDTNKDGIIDKDAFMMPIDVNSDHGWMYTDAKYWPSTKTAMYYIGLGGGSVTGGRFLAPGQAENEGTYTTQLNHKNWEDEAALVAYLEEAGAVKVVRDEDGSIISATIWTNNTYYNNKKFRSNESIALVSTGSRKSDDNILEAIANFYVTGELKLASGFEVHKFGTDIYTKKERPAVVLMDGEDYLFTLPVADPTDDVGNETDDVIDIEDGVVIYVDTNRKGEYSFVSKNAYEPAYTYVATSSDTYKISSDLSSKVVYETQDAHKEQFYAKDIVTLKQDTGYTAYDENYVLSKSGDVMDKLVYVTTDGGAVNEIDNVVDWESTDIYYEVQAGDDHNKYGATGNLIKITAKNYTTWFTQDNVEYLYVGTKAMSNYESYGINALKTPYDFVDYYTNRTAPQGYYETTRGADYFHVNGYYAHEVGTTLYATEKTTNDDSNYALKLGAKNTVTIVDISDAEGDDLKGAYKVASLKVDKKAVYETKGSWVFNIEDMTSYFAAGNSDKAEYTTQEAVDEFVASMNTMPHAYGVYYLETPENDSDKYVFYTGLGSGLENYSWAVNTSKELIYTEDYEGNELTVDAVRLDDKKWYPAFDTEEELVNFVAAITGISKLEGSTDDKKSDFYAWYDAASDQADDERYGITLSEDLPTSADYNLHGAKACDYSVSSEADGSKVTVTSNIADIDTTVAGVKDLVYTASYDGEAVGTTTVKVVVAPKYVRTWENGRVKTLTSYYVSNPEAKYAEYVYDWAKGTVTVTYYNVDGSVNDTSTNSL